MAPPASLFSTLPDELQLKVASAIAMSPTVWQDRAALCLACPRLGVAAIRSIEAYKDPLLAVGIALWHRSATSVLTEQRFRQYLADSKDTRGGRLWLSWQAERHGVGLAFNGKVIPTDTGAIHAIERRLSVLSQGQWVLSALLRKDYSNGRVLHCEGEKGAERMVREHYEGAKGAERVVRVVYPSGRVLHFEGEKGAECMVRVVYGEDGLPDS